MKYKTKVLVKAGKKDEYSKDIKKNTVKFSQTWDVISKNKDLYEKYVSDTFYPCLEELGIKHLQKQKANVLSGGEKRRLEISRALATDPSFILLDEPFAGIDPLAVADIKNIINHLKRRGIGILISDHNVRETLGACDNAYILVDGQVLEAGPPDQIAASEAVCQAYLGDEFQL